MEYDILVNADGKVGYGSVILVKGDNKPWRSFICQNEMTPDSYLNRKDFEINNSRIYIRNHLTREEAIQSVLDFWYLDGDLRRTAMDDKEAIDYLLQNRRSFVIKEVVGYENRLRAWADILTV